MSARSRHGIIHLHSDWSHDGRDSLEDLREWALERSLSFLALSDHAEDFDPDLFSRYLARCEALSDDRLSLIPGLEFRFRGLKGLHLLALGLRRWMQPESPEDFFREAESAGVFTVLAHPVLIRYPVPPVVLDRVHAIEVWNAAYNTRYLPDPGAIRMLRSLRKTRPEVVGTAGLDQHDRRNDRRIRIAIDDPQLAPLEALRLARFTNVGATVRFRPELDWSRGRVWLLAGVRAAFDGVEAIQDQGARRWQKIRQR